MQQNFNRFFRLSRSFILSLHKIGGTRQTKSKLSLHSLALSLHKIGGTRQTKSKLSLPSLTLSLHKYILPENNQPNGYKE
ncbi:hypothetical protein CUB95_00060 [Prevotella intermedia]|nr:hypothetical protein CUB95_00060 [Prevotella intermedia]